MTHRLAANYAKNYCNRTPIVKVIVENVVRCFFGTQCSLTQSVWLEPACLTLESTLLSATVKNSLACAQVN